MSWSGTAARAGATPPADRRRVGVDAFVDFYPRAAKEANLRAAREACGAGRGEGEAREGAEGPEGDDDDARGLSEPEAFRWIQKTAMDRRLGMREVADAVISGMDKA